MRNQIAAAERLGIRAHTINSTNRDAWEEVQELLARDAVDLLLISPERLNNPQFRDAMLPLFAERVGLLVVDEAHCISDWGHDFRPDYRRLAEMLERLPDGVAVLGTTATANDRVVADVEEQLRARRRGAAAHLPRAARALQPAARGSRAARAGRAAGVARDVAAAAGGLGHRLHADQARRRAGRGLAEHPRRSPPRHTAARSRPTPGSRSRSGCWPTRSRRSSPPARSGWAMTSPTSGSSSTTRRRARSSPTTSRSGAPAAASRTPTSCCCAAPRTAASRTSSSSRRSRGASSSSAYSRPSTRRGRRGCR